MFLSCLQNILWMQTQADALEILRRRWRYARGEIDGTIFDQIHERLEYTDRPRG
jgi:hypothetical protein